MLGCLKSKRDRQRKPSAPDQPHDGGTEGAERFIAKIRPALLPPSRVDSRDNIAADPRCYINLPYS